MSNTLVNGIYPLSYFQLAGVSQVQYPSPYWWSSRQRYASIDGLGNYLANNQGGSLTTEYIEIDFGHVRQINYINFDVLRAPIDISIEYDVVSSADRSPTPIWTPVQPIANQPFDDQAYYQGDNRTTWFNGEFHFTDALGNIVNAEHLRIGFTRRDDTWPTASSAPFQWPVFVRNLRVGRFVSDVLDTAGPLVIQAPYNATPVTLDTFGTNTRQIRQQFVLPSNMARGSIVPDIIGFGVMIDSVTSLTAPSSTISFDWEIWDVTSAVPAQLVTGTQTGLVQSGTIWQDIYLESSQFITGDITKIYELRFSSPDPNLLNTFYTTSPDSLSSTAIPGTCTFTNNSTAVATSVDTTATVSVGDYMVNPGFPAEPFLVNSVNSTTITINTTYAHPTVETSGQIIYPMTAWSDMLSSYQEDATQNLLIRVWGNVADEGQDMLGNAYRYGVRAQSADHVVDNDLAGWMSSPMPSPDAVEALYFDVRTAGAMTVIDAIRIASRTPGVRMNVYFSQQNLTGETPATTDDWDYLLWTPVSQTPYVLRRNEVIAFPAPINAAFIKLEFTNLNPLPYQLPLYPPLPPVVYRVFPQWVQSQFSSSVIQNSVSNVFLGNQSIVTTNILSTLANPVLEFEHNESANLAQLALGAGASAQVNSTILTEAAAQIDSETASQVYINNSSQYQVPTTVSVDQSTLLGATIAQQTNNGLLTEPIELQYSPALENTVPAVSSVNSRFSQSYQNMAQLPMMFNMTCRHDYGQVEAYFNKKAFFVGIQSAQFLRTDFTITRDDTFYQENLFDDEMLVTNTWAADMTTSIPDGSTAYVSYSIGGATYVDEAVVMAGTIMITLLGTGAPATNISVYNMPGQQGLRFFQDTDYSLAYGSVNGVRTTSIGRSPFTSRLIAPQQSTRYVDTSLVVGIGVLIEPPVTDAGTAIGVGVPSTANEGLTEPTYGMGVYGGTGTYGDLRSQNVDSGTTIGDGDPSSHTHVVSTDSNKVIGDGVPSTKAETP